VREKPHFFHGGKILSKFSSKTISFSDNKEQKELSRLIRQNNLPVIFCDGDAGTGKTFASLVTSLQLVKEKQYKNILYVREPVEVGKSLGFLPGDIDDKYGVYLDGLQDNLDHISEYTGENANDLAAKIECMPPQFMRGRSLESTIMIIDEAQNLSYNTIQTIITRIGKFCKVIFIGSMNQIDIRGMTKENNDFLKVYNILKNTGLVGYVHLVKSERSEYAAQFDKLLTEAKEKI
jgi:predicted ribonuclease YlaK